MGLIIGTLRKKKTTTELLEKLDKEIKSIEDYGRNTEQQQKKIVGQFLIMSIALYLVSVLLFYFYFYPKNWRDRLMYFIPLVLAPVFIFTSKRGISWYYNRKLSKNQNKLGTLKDEKKKLIEKVMETETYKVAQGILEKYSPQLVPRMSIMPPTPAARNSPQLNSQSGLRQRPVQKVRTSFGTLLSTPTPSPRVFSQETMSSLVPANNQIVPAIRSHSGQMPRSILPRDRSVFDKVVDYLVGDGPANRYAMICQHCSGHNGMALKEEFEYISYNCCYCRAFNPSRKKRPILPKLNMDRQLHHRASTDTSESEKNSGSDNSDTEVTPSDSPREPPETIETLYTNDDGTVNADVDFTSTTENRSGIEGRNANTNNAEVDTTGDSSDGTRGARNVD